MGTIKDRNSMDLTEADEIKKRCQEYTEELYKSLNDPDNHDKPRWTQVTTIVTHLELDILELKWALGNITMNKASNVEVMEF